MSIEAFHSLASWLGLAGDTVTFIGGIVLALEAARQHEQFLKIQQMANTLKSPELVHLKVEVEGVLITDHKDIERAFIRLSARRALIGAIGLAIGFGFLFLARLAEIL
ncbi:MAG TPA: hypothetical protein VJP02_05645 [Candidatus Sulfotelmatobacter sp.]|nr:hypothetical protein [Candidatus Sulfotelmatobacter sp.]